jgi:hypothetical protein
VLESKRNEVYVMAIIEELGQSVILSPESKKADVKPQENHISVAEAPPKKHNKKNHTGSVTFVHAALQAGITGLLVPVVTVPFDKLQMNIVFALGKAKASAVFSDKPLKGYSFVAITSILRNALVFETAPIIERRLEAHGGDTKISKAIGYGFGGILETFFFSPRTVIMQEFYAAQNKKSFLSVIDELTANQKEFVRKIGAACRYGIFSNGLSWPIYIGLVDYFEKELKVNKQKESVAKGLEEFIVGACAGVMTAAVTYPVFGWQQRAVQTSKFSWWKHQKESAKTYGWQMFKEAWWKGCAPSAARMCFSSGAMNLGLHMANGTYHYGVSRGFFKPAKPAAVAMVVSGDHDPVAYLSQLGSP